MKNYILRGNLCYSEDPNHTRIVPNGWLVCVDGRCARVAAGGLRRPPDHPRHHRPACPCAAVCLPGIGNGHGAAGLAECLYLPGGGEICLCGVCPTRLRPVCRASAPQRHDAGLCLCDHPPAGDGAFDAGIGEQRPRQLRRKGEYGPQQSGISLREGRPNRAGRYGTLDLRDKGRLRAYISDSDAAIHPLLLRRADARPPRPCGEIRASRAVASFGELQ